MYVERRKEELKLKLLRLETALDDLHETESTLDDWDIYSCISGAITGLEDAVLRVSEELQKLDDPDYATEYESSYRTKKRFKRSLGKVPSSLRGVDVFAIPLYFPDEFADCRIGLFAV